MSQFSDHNAWQSDSDDSGAEKFHLPGFSATPALRPPSSHPAQATSSNFPLSSLMFSPSSLSDFDILHASDEATGSANVRNNGNSSVKTSSSAGNHSRTVQQWPPQEPAESQRAMRNALSPSPPQARARQRRRRRQGKSGTADTTSAEFPPPLPPTASASEDYEDGVDDADDDYADEDRLCENSSRGTDSNGNAASAAISRDREGGEDADGPTPFDSSGEYAGDLQASLLDAQNDAMPKESSSSSKEQNAISSSVLSHGHVAGLSDNSIARMQVALSSFDLSAHRVPFAVSVTMPMKHGEGLKESYVTYAVETRELLTGNSHSVRRRYSDFAWLYARLVVEFPAAVISPLPGKHRMEYITGDRFSAEFIERRRIALQRFLVRLVRHPSVQKSADLDVFLKSTSWATDQLPPVKRDSSRLEAITGKLVSPKTRLKKPDARFEGVRENLRVLEDGVNTLEGQVTRASRRHRELEHDMAEFAAGLTSLGVLMQETTDAMTAIGTTFLEFTQALRERNTSEELSFASYLREYVNYCGSVRSALRARDSRQLDRETAVSALNNARIEQMRIHNPKENPPSTSQAIGSYIKGKYEEITGVDQERARAERARKLDVRVSELEKEQEAAAANEASFSATIAHEVDFFNASRSADFKEVFSEHIESQIRFYRKAIQKWDAINPALEKIRIDQS